MKLIQIPPDSIEQTWPLVANWISDAIERSNGRHTVESTIDSLQKDLAQLWLAWDEEKKEAQAVAITQLVFYPSGMKVADFIIGTGKNKGMWKHLMTEMEDWAKAEGCGLIQLYCRKGWARELPSFKLSHVLLEKRIELEEEEEEAA